jgi:hypothetical protein
MGNVSPITNTGKSYLRFDRHKREHREKKQRKQAGVAFKNVLYGTMKVDLNA